MTNSYFLLMKFYKILLRDFVCRPMGVGSGGPRPPWVFIHGTDNVVGLIVLFFGLVRRLPPSLLDIFLPTPLHRPPINKIKNFP